MTVHLVGAGPGDPELLTLRAARLIGRADVLVYDRLVAPEILAMAAPWAEMIDVGKNPNGHSTTQDEINEILVSRGDVHDLVVRLKGGDPFVFGRGGEEAAALNEAGIEWTVVPGITSAIAGPSAAGVPVTHRSVSSAFTVVTAHQDPTKDATLDWEALARLGTTLIVLMGAARARQIRDRLVGHGMSADTPVAIVTSATTPQQSTVRMSLHLLGETAVSNPSIIVIGAVADAEMPTAVAAATPTTQSFPLAESPLR